MEGQTQVLAGEVGNDHFRVLQESKVAITVNREDFSFVEICV
jgi:hypothetical protein